MKYINIFFFLIKDSFFQLRFRKNPSERNFSSAFPSCFPYSLALRFASELLRT